MAKLSKLEFGKSMSSPQSTRVPWYIEDHNLQNPMHMEMGQCAKSHAAGCNYWQCWILVIMSLVIVLVP